MTTYLFHPGTAELLATWHTGAGTRVVAVATLTGAEGDGYGAVLADEMTRLAQACWRTYTRFTGVGDSLEMNSPGWRLSQEREAFAQVASAITNPEPDIVVCSVDVLERSHRLGRLLGRARDPHLRAAVLAEVGTELDAVARAELGDLTGRAGQAVTLSRAEVSPTQVQAAWDLLAADLLGCDLALVTRLDPAAASVAALAWLRAAAQAAGGAAGLAWPEVIGHADDLEPLPVGTLSVVVGALSAGLAPHRVVLFLVREAMAVAHGVRLDQRELLTVRDPDGGPRFGDGTFPGRPHTNRLCTLDPARPGPGLLEDLLAGIWGCYLLWREHHLEPVDFDVPDEDADAPPDEEFYGPTVYAPDELPERGTDAEAESERSAHEQWMRTEFAADVADRLAVTDRYAI